MTRRRKCGFSFLVPELPRGSSAMPEFLQHLAQDAMPASLHRLAVSEYRQETDISYLIITFDANLSDVRQASLSVDY
jgi:hypothetical protein